MAYRHLHWLALAAACATEGASDAVDTDAVDTDPFSDPAPFTLVVVPDTQYVSQFYPDVMLAVGTFVEAEASARNIRFVLHEGDMVQDALPAEWEVLTTGLAPFQPEVPFAFAVGNHDLDLLGGTTTLNEALPIADFVDRPSFGGAYDPARSDNLFHTFSAQGTRFVIVTIAWGAPDEVLAWAGGVLSDHADHVGIVLTHDHLTEVGVRSERGQEVWDRVLRAHANLRFVFSGHHTPSGAARQVSIGDAGNEVHELFANYQSDLLYGGAGKLRLLSVDVPARTLRVQTHSPYLDWWAETPDADFLLEDVDYSLD